MSAELDEILEGLLVVALHRAERVPTPAEPVGDAWERAADEYCYRAARTQEFEIFTPEVASALIPRLKFALVLEEDVESQFEWQLRLGHAASTARGILAWL